MKKFSTAALLLAFVAGIGILPISQAQTTAKARCAFLPNAPDQHVVVRGDTLWGISGHFLQNAWCWPQVWGMNREQIRNPHWIYPGQIVYFDRAAGRLRLGTPTGGTSGTIKLSPQIRVEGLGSEAISAIPAEEIAPFLSQPLIIEEDGLNNAPHIVAVQEGHVNLGRNDLAYVRGDLKGGTSFQAFRPGKPLKDPVTGKVIAYEAVYLGTLKLERAGKAENEADTFRIVESKEEMSVGDRLVAVPITAILNYVPHPPLADVNARIVSIYGGVANAGQNQIVTINKGAEDNMEVGNVLQLYRFGKTIADPLDGKKAVKLPDEQYGTLFIFRIFRHISYGLIMQVRDTVEVGDIARSPE
ncbi:LysM peptidoglycan-binding domain-containing protein [Glaciimonas sp. Gout2]|uniref:LysM peptidoglycan-binding domain-containing protein n=1 Tax=unclassified Glaciimonas TaxID=2644401 RepID=UPI002B23E642|nr:MULTISPECIES: LysM peptidoglycan-binding domain-containing protein [unclassified Glaciimonas]MEB0010721.1 LysM peptidoglycan-binding domain-containing protein [Glaciimonas sp. Cout2]MEB0082143.1 LysM peptidoglycan-binding domain-containing protein [Glaciimonas sp. Gout2]